MAERNPFKAAPRNPRRRRNPLDVEPEDALVEGLSKLGPMMSEGRVGQQSIMPSVDPGNPAVAEILDRPMPPRKGGRNAIGLMIEPMLREKVPADEMMEALLDEIRIRDPYKEDPMTQREEREREDMQYELWLKRYKQLVEDKAQTPDMLMSRLVELNPRQAAAPPEYLADLLWRAEKAGDKVLLRKLHTTEGLRKFLAHRVAWAEVARKGSQAI